MAEHYTEMDLKRGFFNIFLFNILNLSWKCLLHSWYFRLHHQELRILWQRKSVWELVTDLIRMCHTTLRGCLRFNFRIANFNQTSKIIMKAAHHKQLSVRHIFAAFSKMWNVVKNLNHEILKTFKKLAGRWRMKTKYYAICPIPVFQQQFNKKCHWTQLKERISCWLTEAVSQTNTLWFASQ